MDIGQLMMSGFPQVDTGNVADAAGSDAKIMDFGIKPLHYTMKVAGPVYTIDQPTETNLPILKAISRAPAGSVLVINAQGYMKTGHFGSLVSLACQLRNIAGIIIDGAIRDVPDIIEMGFPVFARGAVPKGNTPYQGTYNHSIPCGGIQVEPDDMVFADATGVVVFPKAKAQTIYERAVFIATQEMGFVQAVNQGKDLLDLPQFLKLHHITQDMLEHDNS